MNNIYEIDMIIYNKKYSFIYSYKCILLLILLVTTYILFLYDYHTYYYGTGIMNNHLLEIELTENNISIIKDKSIIKINKTKYSYQIAYQDNNKIYLKINNIRIEDNQALEFQILKKKQKIIYYILDYLERRKNGTNK